MTADVEPGRTLRRRVLVGLLLGLLALVFVVVYYAARMMGPPPATEAQFSAAAPDEQVEVALEVTDAPSQDLLEGRLLEPSDGSTYRRTDRAISVRWRTDTPVVMGGREDVRAGAVLQAKGRIDKAGSLNAERVVVLTGYVKVE